MVECILYTFSIFISYIKTIIIILVLFWVLKSGSRSDFWNGLLHKQILLKSVRLEVLQKEMTVSSSSLLHSRHDGRGGQR